MLLSRSQREIGAGIKPIGHLWWGHQGSSLRCPPQPPTLVFFSFSWGYTALPMESYSLTRDWTYTRLQWKHRVLTTGFQGKSLALVFLNFTDLSLHLLPAAAPECQAQLPDRWPSQLGLQEVSVLLVSPLVSHLTHSHPDCVPQAQVGPTSVLFLTSFLPRAAPFSLSKTCPSFQLPWSGSCFCWESSRIQS